MPSASMTLSVVLVDGQPVAFGRIVVGQSKLIRFIDAKALGNMVELHGAISARREFIVRHNAAPERRSRSAASPGRNPPARARCGYPTSSGCFSRLRCASMRARKASAFSSTRTSLICAIRLPSTTHVQPGAGDVSPGVKPGLFLEFARARCARDRPCRRNVVGIGRAAGKIDLPGVGRFAGP